MGFVAPAVHYAALATNPPDNDLMVNHHLTKHSNRFLASFSRLLKNFVHQPVENRSTNTDLSSESLRNDVNLSGFVTDSQKTATLSNYGRSRVSLKETMLFSDAKNSSKSISSSLTERSEKLPFTDLCCSSPLRNEKHPCNRLAYQKHCSRQEKFINQKHNRPRSTFFSPSLFEQSTSNILLTSQRASITCQKEAEKSYSTTKLPIASREENILDDSCRFRQFTDNVQPLTRLRRLQSKSKVRPVSIEEIRNSSVPDSLVSSPIASSIAQRIELLKNAMHRKKVENFDDKLDRRRYSNVKFDQETQTLIKTELHHVYHHHDHHLHHQLSTLRQFQWRLLFALVTSILIIIYLVEVFTIVV